MSRHISRTAGHLITFFRSNVSDKSVTNIELATPESFTDFSDSGFLRNDDIQAMDFMESLTENPQLERNSGRLEQFPNAGTTSIRISWH